MAGSCSYTSSAAPAISPDSSDCASASSTIEVANPDGQTAQPRPYKGAQFVAIPEFQGIGTQVGQTIAGTLTGQTTVDQALKGAQAATERTMRQAGYPKE